MDNFSKRFKIDCSPVADKNQTIANGKTRLTVIAPCLLRVEVQKDGKFCNEPTQSVWFRDFCKTNFETTEKNGVLEIKTETKEILNFDTAQEQQFQSSVFTLIIGILSFLGMIPCVVYAWIKIFRDKVFHRKKQISPHRIK
jgi:hypothetical protein